MSANLSQGPTTSAPKVLFVKQSTNEKDKEWEERVTGLERELKDTQDYYLKRIDALEKEQNVFTD